MKHVHIFDPVSGWCLTCTVRDDGRHLWHGSDVSRSTTDAEEANE